MTATRPGGSLLHRQMEPYMIFLFSFSMWGYCYLRRIWQLGAYFRQITILNRICMLPKNNKSSIYELQNIWFDWIIGWERFSTITFIIIWWWWMCGMTSTAGLRPPSRSGGGFASYHQLLNESSFNSRQSLLDKIYREFYPDHPDSSETFDCQTELGDAFSAN